MVTEPRYGSKPTLLRKVMTEAGTETGPDAAQQQAVRLAGLSSAPDADMDRFTRLVTRLLRVPVALVSLMERDRVILPGMRSRMRCAGTWCPPGSP